MSKSVYLAGVDVDSEMTRLTLVVVTMRSLGVTRYGDIELGPMPISDSAVDETQRPTASDAEQRRREERRRVSLASSGGPLRRLDADK